MQLNQMSGSEAFGLPVLSHLSKFISSCISFSNANSQSRQGLQSKALEGGCCEAGVSLCSWIAAIE